MIGFEQMQELRRSYIEIGKLVQKYGYGQYSGLLKILMGQIKCIDSNEDEKTKHEYLVESYNVLFAQRNGLGEFVINEKDKELRCKLNEKYNSELTKAYQIMKEYATDEE